MQQAETNQRAPHTRRRSQDPDAFPRRIDISRFKEIGRINRASQATSWEDYDARVAVLDELYDAGNLELLREFQAGTLRMDDLMRLKRQRRLDAGVGSLRLTEPLFAAFDRVLAKLGATEKTRQNYESLSLRLTRNAVPAITEHSTVRELERLDWKATAERWASDGGGASGQTWNNMIIALGSFLTELLGDVGSSDRRRIMSRIPRAAKAAGRVPDVTIEQVAAVIKGMPWRTGPTALTLLLTGLRAEELRGGGASALRENLQAIDVQPRARPRKKKVAVFDTGLKNTASQGLVYVPEGFWSVARVAVLRPPSYVTLRRHWCQRCHEVGLGQLTRTKDDPGHRWPQTFEYTGMRLHDLRHCYAQWIHGGGMPLAQLRDALRHADLESSARYAAQRAKRDAARIAGAVIGAAFEPTELWPRAQDNSADE